MTGYCAACGKKAPASAGKHAPELDPGLLRERGWICVAAKPLYGRDRDVGWNLLCPGCLAKPSPFAEKLLETWGVSPRE
ncbi:MAG: hypothetical protein ACYDCL_09525 [Myxococcales bacterium]